MSHHRIARARVQFCVLNSFSPGHLFQARDCGLSAASHTYRVDAVDVNGDTPASGTNTPTTTVPARLGSDNLNGWPQRPTSNGLATDFDEFVLYRGLLSGVQMRQQMTSE